MSNDRGCDGGVAALSTEGRGSSGISLSSQDATRLRLLEIEPGGGRCLLEDTLFALGLEDIGSRSRSLVERIPSVLSVRPSWSFAMRKVYEQTSHYKDEALSLQDKDCLVIMFLIYWDLGLVNAGHTPNLCLCNMRCGYLRAVPHLTSSI